MQSKESSLYFADELDASVAVALQAMLAEKPDAVLVAQSLKAIRGQGPAEQRGLVRCPPKQLVSRSRSRLAIAASLLMLSLWLSSQTTAWGQVVQDFVRQQVIKSTQSATVDAMHANVARETEVGSALRFILMLHVLGLLAGWMGMGLAWIVSLLESVLANRYSATYQNALAGWRRRVHGAALALLAAGIVLGCVWAYATCGWLWRWDPREASALSILCIGLLWYLGTTEVSSVNTVQPVLRRTAIASIGFWLMTLTQVLTSQYMSQQHSYGMSTWLLPNVLLVLMAINLLTLSGAAVLLRTKRLRASSVECD